jgi:hypothetical protein
MARKNSVAVFVVIFPAIEHFLKEYFISLEKQSFKDFDIVVINDGFDSFQKAIGTSPLRIDEIRHGGTPSKIREFGIRHLQENNYEYVVFTDADDTFAPNRIEKSIELLKYHDIVVNDITTISKEGNILDSLYISNRLTNRAEIVFEFIIDKNIFGFSNTSLRLSCLQEQITFNGNLIAPDWYFFSRLLLKGCSTIFTNETVTYYRQYENNILGLAPMLDEEKLEKGIKLKLAHYAELAKFDKRFDDLYNYFIELKINISVQKYKMNYIEKINKLRINKPLWSEHIKLLRDQI